MNNMYSNFVEGIKRGIDPVLAPGEERKVHAGQSMYCTWHMELHRGTQRYIATGENGYEWICTVVFPWGDGPFNGSKFNRNTEVADMVWFINAEARTAVWMPLGWVPTHIAGLMTEDRIYNNPPVELWRQYVVV